MLGRRARPGMGRGTAGEQEGRREAAEDEEVGREGFAWVTRDLCLISDQIKGPHGGPYQTAHRIRQDHSEHDSPALSALDRPIWYRGVPSAEGNAKENSAMRAASIVAVLAIVSAPAHAGDPSRLASPVRRQEP